MLGCLIISKLRQEEYLFYEFIELSHYDISWQAAFGEEANLRIADPRISVGINAWPSVRGYLLAIVDFRLALGAINWRWHLHYRRKELEMETFIKLGNC